MAGISKIGELEQRKRALVTESELCREALKAEIQKLRQQSGSVLHTVDRVRRVGPWVMLAAPVVAPLLGVFFGKRVKAPRPPSPLKNGLATGLMALRVFRDYGPAVQNLIAQFRNKRRRAANARPNATNS